MSQLWRCDVCHELIDPVLEGDTRTILEIGLDGGNTLEERTIDLCEDCRPSSIDAFGDWLMDAIEDADQEGPT